ncbi:hypothetical protein [Azospirillum sp. TSH100]|uniref:hypothetical protein n=1 Tax=Azospirillum sp. TSH100 TaxID=652764 RepID=UPI0018EEBFFB|nr:hypothetical protein [Azospirillum sp. TSH100]
MSRRSFSSRRSRAKSIGAICKPWRGWTMISVSAASRERPMVGLELPPVLTMAKTATLPSATAVAIPFAFLPSLSPEIVENLRVAITGPMASAKGEHESTIVCRHPPAYYNLQDFIPQHCFNPRGATILQACAQK